MAPHDLVLVVGFALALITELAASWEPADR
jgi:hypothetical protein